MENRFKVIHINTTTKDRYPTTDGNLNSEPIIEKGEIAVNGAEDGEFLAIVNTANKIKIFKDWDSIKSEIDKNVLTIKEFTLDGSEGELPVTEWESFVNSDLYICNGTYIYSHVTNGNKINFDIVTNMASHNTTLTSTTIAFYTIENTGEKLIWNYKTYTGKLVEDVVEETGDSTIKVMSQKGITEQFATTNNNLTQLQDTVNTINNNYRKKVVSISSTETSKTIDANTYYKWGTMTSLTISLNTNVDSGILNEYIFEFVSGSTPTTLSLPSSIKWLNGLTPLIKANKTYQVSIVNNLGVIAEFA